MTTASSGGFLLDGDSARGVARIRQSMLYAQCVSAQAGEHEAEGQGQPALRLAPCGCECRQRQGAGGEGLDPPTSEGRPGDDQEHE